MSYPRAKAAAQAEHLSAPPVGDCPRCASPEGSYDPTCPTCLEVWLQGEAEWREVAP